MIAVRLQLLVCCQNMQNNEHSNLIAAIVSLEVG